MTLEQLLMFQGLVILAAALVAIPALIWDWRRRPPWR